MRKAILSFACLLAAALFTAQTTILPKTTVLPNTTAIAAAAAGGSDPSSIAVSNQQVWYRSDSMVCTGGCSGTNVVTSLTNKFSGTNACTTSNSPTYVASAVNSLPGVLWNGTTQDCALGSTIAWNATTRGITVFVVSEPAADSANHTFISGNSNSFGYKIKTDNRQAADKVDNSPIGGSNTALTAAYKCTAVTYNDSTGVLAFYLSGVADGGVTNALAITVPLSNGFSNFGAGDEFWNGTWVEMAVWDTVIATSDITTTLKNYCSSRYGL